MKLIYSFQSTLKTIDSENASPKRHKPSMYLFQKYLGYGRSMSYSSLEFQITVWFFAQNPATRMNLVRRS